MAKQKIKAWAIVGFDDSYFIASERQLMVYIDKKSAEKANEGMDEDIIEVEITPIINQTHKRGKK